MCLNVPLIADWQAIARTCCEIIDNLVYYLVPQLHTVYLYWYPATVLVYLRTCLLSLLGLKPQQKGFPNLLVI
jgi:hypothetical protein